MKKQLQLQLGLTFVALHARRRGLNRHDAGCAIRDAIKKIGGIPLITNKTVHDAIGVAFEVKINSPAIKDARPECSHIAGVWVCRSRHIFACARCGGVFNTLELPKKVRVITRK